jgi:hypothetical protein
MFIFNRQSFLSGVAMLLLWVGVAHAGTIMIDDFNTTEPFTMTGPQTRVDDTSGNVGDLIGNYRDTTVTGNAFPEVEFNYSNIIYTGNSDTLGTVMTTYDGYGTGGSLNLNLYDVGNTGYFTLHDFLAEGDGFLNIIVTDNLGHSSSGQTVTFTDNITDLFGDVTEFSLDYNTYALDGVDLSDIKKIDFYFEATSHGAAIAFGAITATTFPSSIPEPASFVMLSMGCFLMMSRRNRIRPMVN